MTQAGSYNYQCDPNGNVVGGNTLTAIYDAENRAAQITRTAVAAMTQSGTMSWRYGADGAMAMEMDQGSSITGTRYFGPAGYEQVGSGAAATQKYELGPVVVTRTNNGLGSSTDALTVVLRDRLGSTIDMIENGGTPTTRAYDAFGAARNGDFGDRTNGTLNLVDGLLGGLQTIHGFTKHDHADDVALIHMGGRVYDYSLGRFLQVDPIISNPANSQHLNPYSYIGNNPLSGTDPTGYQQCTGSNIERASCASPTLSSTQVATPSVSEQKANFVKWAGGMLNNAFNNTTARNNGADHGATTNGAPSAPGNNQAESIGGQSQTIQQRSVQQMGTITVNGYAINPLDDPEDYRQVYQTYLNHDQDKYNAWFEREQSSQMARGLGKEFILKPIAFTLGGMYFGALGARLLYLDEISVGLAAGSGDFADAAYSATRVGRWMSQAEYDSMVATGRVQQSNLNGVTSVSSPPNPGAWIRQTTAPNYVEFDVPSSAVRPIGSANAKIYGPNSIFGPRLGITEMPSATNIMQTACRVPLACN